MAAVPLVVPPAGASSAPQAAPAFRMPNLAGKNLQLAQDMLQARGSYLMDQRDALGLGRVQLLDSNWRVCRTRPAPGQRVRSSTLVVVWSVKLTERCP